MHKMSRQGELKTEHKASIKEYFYIHGKLLDITDCMILLDMGASKSFMYKTFLFKLSIITFFTKVCIKDKEYFSRQWSVHRCIICHT